MPTIPKAYKKVDASAEGIIDKLTGDISKEKIE
jgi:hypothetical protein